MSLESFNKLLSYTKEALVSDNRHGDSHGGIIEPEMQLFCCLRWLAGCSYLDVHSYVNISNHSFYRVCYKVIDAINKCSALDIVFPSTLEDCKKIASEYEEISYKSAITNCIGCIDGYLLKIKTPPKEEVGNVRSYFSGHYQRYGLNIQAVCDSNCRFIYFAVAAPGSSSDREALMETSLMKKLELLPEPFVLIADAAYEPSEKIVPMYYGVDRTQVDADNFNYFASQCRIRIEMSFGYMFNKWSILWRPLRSKMHNISHVIMAIARLHNYTINERITDGANIKEVVRESYLDDSGKVIPNLLPRPASDSKKRRRSNKDDDYNLYYKGQSFIREEMNDRIKKLGLSRPLESKENLELEDCLLIN
jgi:hypothetical protein